MYKDLFELPVAAGTPLPLELPGWIACAPFEDYLGMVIEEAKEGHATLSMPFKVKLAQGKGLMHGGAVTALADTAVAMAIKSMLPEGTHFVTTDLHLKFHAPIHGGLVTAQAEAIRVDERTIKGRAEVFDENGVKAATFTSEFRIKKQKPGSTVET